jgi:hypothetical protein
MHGAHVQEAARTTAFDGTRAAETRTPRRVTRCRTLRGARAPPARWRALLRRNKDERLDAIGPGEHVVESDRPAQRVAHHDRRLTDQRVDCRCHRAEQCFGGEADARLGAEAVSWKVRSDHATYVAAKAFEHGREWRRPRSQSVEDNSRRKGARPSGFVCVDLAVRRAHPATVKAATAQCETTEALGKRQQDGLHRGPVPS